MSAGAAFAVLLATALFLAILWRRLPEDTPRATIVPRGTHTRAAWWMRHVARLPAVPVRDGVVGPTAELDTPPARALQAVVYATAARRGIPAAQARARLGAAHADPVVRAFLAGRTRLAARLHARALFGGPRPLFPLWYLSIALVRLGPRRLRLDALHHAIKELRK